ncbi:MAG: glycosyltransferase family 39 protein [Nitrospirae bacterium YQR-1]
MNLSKPDTRRTEFYTWLLLIVAMAFITAVRIRFLDFPMERDEGEYAYIARLILERLEPYKYAYTMKLPGTALIYAFFMSIFGQTVRGIHIGLLITNLATIVVIYMLIKHVYNATTGVVSAMSYGFFTLSYSFLGFSFHATQLIVLFCTLGLYFLMIALRKQTSTFYAIAGFFLGCGFLMKQHGIYFLFFAVCYFLYHNRLNSPQTPVILYIKQNAKYEFSKLCYLLAAFFIPLILVVMWVYSMGDFQKFFYWTFVYANKYVSSETISSSVPRIKVSLRAVFKGFHLLWILALLGFILQFFIKLPAVKKVFTNLLFFFTVFAVSAGLYFRPHYFIMMLPAVVIFIGIAVQRLNEFLTEKFKLPNVAFIIFLIIVATGFWADRNYFFKLPLPLICNTIYKNNPFNEAPQIAELITAHTGKDDRIAVFGSEPEILFLSDRLSVTGYIYTYGLMEIHDGNMIMQMELISEIMANPPKLIVYCHVYKSWTPRKNSPQYIFQWFDKNIYSRYEKIAVIDYVENGKYSYIQGNDAKEYSPVSEDYIEILKQKDGINKNFIWLM